MRISTRIAFFIISLALASCTFTQKIKDGKTAYQQKQYAVAIPFFEKDFNRAKLRTEKGTASFHLGECHAKLGNVQEALTWYLTAYENNYGPKALEAHAYLLKQTEQYDEARKMFKQLGMEIGSPFEYRREETACKNAMEWIKNIDRSPFDVEPLPINSSYSDFSMSPFRAGTFVFVSDRNNNTSGEVYNWTGRNFMDLYLYDASSQQVQPFDSGLNTEDHEGPIVFNTGHTRAYFTKCKDGGDGEAVYCRIFESKWEDGQWATPTPLPFQDTEHNYMHPAIADNGTLYFASNHEDGWGGYDIYQTSLENGKWKDPVLLSRSINTVGNELFPTVDADTLFFSSDHLSGMGGLDIFKSYKMGKKRWTPAYNMKAPINSGADDFGLVLLEKAPNEEFRSGYFTSSRSGGSGFDDIYAFTKRKAPEIPEVPEIIEYSMALDVFVLEKVLSDPTNPNSALLGRKQLAEAELVYVLDGDTMRVKTNENEAHRIELEQGKSYTFKAMKDGYFTKTSSFSTEGIALTAEQPNMVFEMEILLDKVYTNVEIVLENIYYDFDKWDIRSDAKPTLNQLSSVLKENPDIAIELGSHTDCRGSNDYNEELSQKRAESAVDYLISTGIDKKRVRSVGYGENNPAMDCACNRCTEEEHQANRRTTFKVLKKRR